MTETAVRLLRLLALLQERAHWTGADLAERLGVRDRTVRVDVGRLRSLGYEITATPGAGGGYRLHAGSAIPPLLLADEEAVAVAVVLRTAANVGLADVGAHVARATAKLERLLPAPLRRRLATVGAVTETTPSRRDEVPVETLAAVAGVCDRAEQLRFDYTDRHHGTTRRRVEPHRLVHVGGRWYLVATTSTATTGAPSGPTASPHASPPAPGSPPRELPGPDLAAFVTRGRMTALWAYRATVTVDAPAELVAIRVPTGSWLVEPVDARHCRLEAGGHTAELLATYLGALGLDLHVDAQQAPELAHDVDTLATRYHHATTPRLDPPDTNGGPTVAWYIAGTQRQHGRAPPLEFLGEHGGPSHRHRPVQRRKPISG